MTDETWSTLEDLLTACLDNDDSLREPDRGCVDRLKGLLKNNPEAQSLYVEFCQMHSMLAWEHGVLNESVFSPKVPTKTSPSSQQARRFRTSFRGLGWLSLAVGLMVTVSVYFWSFASPELPKPGEAWSSRELLAELTRSDGASLRVTDLDLILAPGDALRTGKYELSEGFVQLTFSSGVEVIVESPSRFEMVSQTRLVLDAGRLSAKVSPEGTGFTVETPTADVVDFGTEFSVEVTPDDVSEVHVFMGEVEVRPKHAGGVVRLHTDEATRMSTISKIPQGIDIDPDRFLRDLVERPRAYPRAVRALNPVSYFRMGSAPDGVTLENRGEQQEQAYVNRHQMRRPAFAPGYVGGALCLNGPSGGAYAVLPEYSTAVDDQLTVCLWTRAESRPRWATLVSNWDENVSGQFDLGCFQDDGDLAVRVRDRQGKLVTARENALFPLGRWQHVAFVVDGKFLTLYRNAERVATTPCEGLTSNACRVLGIGAKLNMDGSNTNPASPGFWDGRLDELAIFHQALPASEIRRLYELSLEKQ